MLYLALCTENEVEYDKMWIMGIGFLLGLVDAVSARVRQLRDERGADLELLFSDEKLST